MAQTTEQCMALCKGTERRCTNSLDGVNARGRFCGMHRRKEQRAGEVSDGDWSEDSDESSGSDSFAVAATRRRGGGGRGGDGRRGGSGGQSNGRGQGRRGVAFDDAFRTDVFMASGGWRSAASTVTRKIAALVSGASDFWIGITSNGDAGVRDRWNKKYKKLGMKHIAVVYDTTSDTFRREMESDLIEHFYDSANKVDGGGGGRGSPPYSVYVAWC